jgi:hypothetical protein
MALCTLQFPDHPTARAAAQSLGFWDTDADQLRTSGQGRRPDGTVLGETMEHGGLTWEWTAKGWAARQ